MIIERFEVSGLSHFSYAVGSSQGIAIVDPRRDIDIYLEYSKSQGVPITHVLETHIHADYASGARELTKVTGAQLSLSAYDRGETYQVAFAHRPLADGDEIELGEVKIRAIHTPGHTPEHMSFLVFEKNEPALMLTGDFLFVGSFGRPDLLGEEAKRPLAKKLYQSIQKKLLDLPGALDVLPAHGAGSLCGASIGRNKQSTLALEKQSNPFLVQPYSETDFVDEILAVSPHFPSYFKRMKQLNADGPAILGGLPGLCSVSKDALPDDVCIVDCRDPLEFAEGHLPGAISLGMSPSVSFWAGQVVPYETPIALVVSDDAMREGAVRALIRVGLDDIRGSIDVSAQTETFAQIEAADLIGELKQGSLEVLDVRSQKEWDSGHLDGAFHIPLEKVAEAEFERSDRPLAVICGGGYRSTIAISLLLRKGHQNLLNATGGMSACRGQLLRG